jgi:putative ubiquitin-RnfH superfamily antitoxin RatB of RatAB toxin-antitoxin module
MATDRSPDSGTEIEVQVAYVIIATDSLPAASSAGYREVEIRTVKVRQGATVVDVLQSLPVPGLLEALSNGHLSVAIFGERASLASPVRAGDRVELLGPLLADPKHARSHRAALQRSRGGDGRWTGR